MVKVAGRATNVHQRHWNITKSCEWQNRNFVLFLLSFLNSCKKISVPRGKNKINGTTNGQLARIGSEKHNFLNSGALLQHFLWR